MNNFALAFQPSSVVSFINLSNNQMRLIADNAFDNLIVHRLYLNNNRLRKFPQSLFEPILSNMAKINIEQKIFHGETEMNYPESSGLSEFSGLTFRNAAIDWEAGRPAGQTAKNASASKTDKLTNQLGYAVDKKATGNPAHKAIKMSNSLSGENSLRSGADSSRDRLANANRRYLKGSSSDVSLATRTAEQSPNNSSPEDFNEELNMLIRLDLSGDLLEQLVYDFMSKNLIRPDRSDERWARTKRRPKLGRNANDLLSSDELDSLFYSQLFDWQTEAQADEQTLVDHKASPNPAKPNGHLADQFLDSSNSFREEIKVANRSSVFFDDEPTVELARPSAHLNFEGDQTAAFIDVLGKRIISLMPTFYLSLLNLKVLST